MTRTLRRVMPSLSRITFNPFVKVMLNVGETPARLWFKEFRSLPPNHLRIRVGMASGVRELVANHVRYLNDSRNFWLNAALNGYFKMDSTIVDIGVGIGRTAHHLRDFKYFESRFVGKYIGVDIDADALRWCRANFDDRFQFHLSTDSSASYHNAGSSDGPYQIPEPAGSVDFVFSQSLFTHLLEREAENYLAETYRLLKPGGYSAHSVFCIDYPPPTFGDRHTFSHVMGEARVESLAQPEAAVAYTEDWLLKTAKKIGFSKASLQHSPDAWQPSLVCQK